VHKARLADGREVAVKIQYAGLETAVGADISTLSFLAAAATRWFPNAFDFGRARHPSLCPGPAGSACKKGVWHNGGANAPHHALQL
jgi:hypothetical protein